MNKSTLTLTLAGLVALGSVAASAQVTKIGSDLNSTLNPLVQPLDPALAGGGIDQTMQFGDLLKGQAFDDLLIGRLGTDLISGGDGDDVMVGGVEHFNPSNRDRAFGGNGSDTFVWKPGDGSDLFFGGSGEDAIVFGLIGEVVDGATEFAVVDDQLAGEVFINPHTGLPEVDLTNSPGFCEIIDGTDSADAAELDALGLDHLVRFALRAVRDDFENGVQDTDNGVRVTLHLNSVEVLVCTNRAGGEILYYDLTTQPATLIDPSEIGSALRAKLDAMIF